LLKSLDYRLLKKISEARCAETLIVSVNRDREIRTSTNTPHNTNSREAIERNEAYESFSAA
jgi:hypothetical protein